MTVVIGQFKRRVKFYTGILFIGSGPTSAPVQKRVLLVSRKSLLSKVGRGNDGSVGVSPRVDVVASGFVESGPKPG